MSAGLRVAFAREGPGWMRLTLGVDERECSTAFADLPADSLRQVAAAVQAPCVNALAASAWLNGEPEETELRLETERSEQEAVVRLLVRYPGGRRSQYARAEVFAAGASRRELGMAFWRALRRLESEFKMAADPPWRFDFPREAVERLGAALNG